MRLAIDDAHGPHRDRAVADDDCESHRGTRGTWHCARDRYPEARSSARNRPPGLAVIEDSKPHAAATIPTLTDAFFSILRPYAALSSRSHPRPSFLDPITPFPPQTMPSLLKQPRFSLRRHTTPFLYSCLRPVQRFNPP